MIHHDKKTIKYVYDPQLTDPLLDIYPPFSLNPEHERWVAAICMIPYDEVLRPNSFNPYV